MRWHDIAVHRFWELQGSAFLPSFENGKSDRRYQYQMIKIGIIQSLRSTNPLNNLFITTLSSFGSHSGSNRLAMKGSFRRPDFEPASRDRLDKVVFQDLSATANASNHQIASQSSTTSHTILEPQQFRIPAPPIVGIF